MKRATLLFNPSAGKGRLAPEVLHSVQTALRKAGVDAALEATQGPGTAAEQARLAAASSGIVFACGGDGTVHEALQGLAGNPAVTLGILPFGSANVLARHLGLSLDPIRAALQQLERPGVLVPLGQVSFVRDGHEQSRYFASVAGAGADGLLAYRTLAATKRRLGRAAYSLRAAQLAMRHRLPAFRLTELTESGKEETSLAVTVMTSRVDSLGGLFRQLVRRGSVADTHLELTAVHPPSPWSLPCWFALSWAGLASVNRWQKHARVVSFHCGEGLTGPVHVQADGEWLGRTPMHVRLVPDAVRLPLPRATATSRSAQ